MHDDKGKVNGGAKGAEVEGKKDEADDSDTVGDEDMAEQQRISEMMNRLEYSLIYGMSLDVK